MLMLMATVSPGLLSYSCSCTGGPTGPKTLRLLFSAAKTHWPLLSFPLFCQEDAVADHGSPPGSLSLSPLPFSFFFFRSLPVLLLLLLLLLLCRRQAFFGARPEPIH
jgi:hypothetical protein